MPDVSLCFLGDICLHGSVEQYVLRRWDYDPFQGIRPLVGASGVLVANIESTLSRRGLPKLKYATLRADPDVIKKLGRIDVAIVGNNHIADFGDESGRDTVEHLRSSGVLAVGWGDHLAEAMKPAILERGGIQLGFLSFSCLSTNGLNYATPATPGVAPLSLTLLRQAIERTRPLCDVLVVYCHWGVEQERTPVPDQMRIARRAIDWGADAVVGTHAHVIQAYEQYQGRWIFYGLGNFLAGDVCWHQHKPDGTVESGLLVQRLPNKQSLAVCFKVVPDGSSSRLELDRVQPLMFAGDLVPRPIRASELDFDLEAANARLSRYAARHSSLLSGTGEIAYRTYYSNGNFKHTYWQSPVDGRGSFLRPAVASSLRYTRRATRRVARSLLRPACRNRERATGSK